ncbi:Reverse transcriptase (RNA-dependent DNA polymerase) [Popillia japonica]|uniref:Reverse transcriptase (RNA-dependent DNA polymerase) n=1 Tax=Popillia japonica TaxID=7064 RepID=A0AAW1M423_POPJA
MEDYVTYYVGSDPQDPDEALLGPNGAAWKTAMNEELESLKRNDVYSIADVPHDKKVLNTKWVFKTKPCTTEESVKFKARLKVLNTKWVFKTKPCTTEESVKFKARLVVKGCAQTEGIDYQETYSPVVKCNSLRYLFSLAAKKNLEIDHMETYSPVVKCNSLRYLFSLAAKKNLEIDHMDVKTAYLQSILDEEIYVKPPKEFRDPKKPSQV